MPKMNGVTVVEDSTRELGVGISYGKFQTCLLSDGMLVAHNGYETFFYKDGRLLDVGEVTKYLTGLAGYKRLAARLASRFWKNEKKHRVSTNDIGHDRVGIPEIFNREARKIFSGRDYMVLLRPLDEEVYSGFEEEEYEYRGDEPKAIYELLKRTEAAIESGEKDLAENKSILAFLCNELVE